MKIVEASLSDFDEVYSLLQQLNNPKITKEIWQKTYNDPFNSGGSPGYLLKEENQVVGFFGTIYSKRRINEIELNFCNCHSWVVDIEHRTKGLILLNKIHKIKDHILTIFSASGETFGIYKQLNWKEIDNTYSTFLVNPLRKSLGDQLSVLTESMVYTQLDEEEKQIYEDHKGFSCKQNVLKIDLSHAFQIFKEIEYFPAKFSAFRKIVPWKYRLGQLYYTSNPELFFSDFKNSILAICKKENWIGLVIPNRLLKKAGISAGRKYYKNRPVLIKNDQGLEMEQLDLLYSEVFTLDLN